MSRCLSKKARDFIRSNIIHVDNVSKILNEDWESVTRMVRRNSKSLCHYDIINYIIDASKMLPSETFENETT